MCLALAWSNLADAADYRFILRVQPGKSVIVYQTPSQSSKALKRLTPGQSSEILKRQQGWLLVKIRLKGSSYIQGWVQQSSSAFKIYRQSIISDKKSSPRTKAASSSGKPKKQKQKKDTSKDWEQWLAQDAGYQTSLRVGPVYNIQDYTDEGFSFSNAQLRIGLAIEKMVAPKLRLGVPVQFALNNTFKTIETGLEASYYLLTKNAIGIYAQLGATYEYLFNGDQSFSGANLLGGLGVDYLLNDQWMVGITPISVQTMLWRSESNIPLNIRGQILLTVRRQW